MVVVMVLMTVWVVVVSAPATMVAAERRATARMDLVCIVDSKWVDMFLCWDLRWIIWKVFERCNVYKLGLSFGVIDAG